MVLNLENRSDEEILKEDFVFFLNEMNEKHLDNKLSSDAVVKNQIIYDAYISNRDNITYLRAVFWKNYNTIRELKTDFETSIFFKNHKVSLQKWTYLFLPLIKIGNNIVETWKFKVSTIVILEKKNNQDPRESIKTFIGWLLPWVLPIRT